ncbi:MAG TPA: LUD domain-containing protein [Verrucomicrobiae bacterium]|nr:LUD domain-containing protein [Verrucomicrobiae bacterium]
MSERAKILGRIREALSVAAPFPGAHEPAAHPIAATTASARAGEWLPRVGQSRDEQIAAFAANAADLRAEFFPLASGAELVAQLQKMRYVDAWKKIATHSGELTGLIQRALDLPTVFTDAVYDGNALESCDVGITECDALVAQTGSVLVTNRTCGGRALSVLPPHHIVLARRDQLVRDLPAAFQWLRRTYDGNYPSMISFITGPSRTGDIERILVLGAHGPRRLTIFMV